MFVGLSHALQYLFLAFALAYWIVSFVMTMGARGLTDDIASLEADDARERAGSGSYFYRNLNFRYNPGVPKGMLIALLSVAATGFFVVYVVVNSLVIVGLVVVQGYLVYANSDSIEAFLFSRFLAGAPRAEVGRWELEQARWASKELDRGRTAFLLLGTAMFLLSFATSQLVTLVEALIAYYTGAVYSTSSIVPAPFSIVLVAVIYVLTSTGILWLGRRGLGVMRGRTQD